MDLHGAIAPNNSDTKSRTVSFSCVILFLLWTTHILQCIGHTISESVHRIEGLNDRPKWLRRYHTLEVGVILYLSRRQWCKQRETTQGERFSSVPLNEGRHKDRTKFKSHVISFTDIKTLPHRKGFAGVLLFCACKIYIYLQTFENTREM